MSLSDELTRVKASTDARRSRAKHPDGLAPGYRLNEDDGLPEEAVSAVRASDLPNGPPRSEVQWRADVQRVTGFELPDELEVVLTDVRRWGPPEDPYVYCKYRIKRRAGSISIDAAAMLRALRGGRAARAAKSPGLGDGAFILPWNDWQVGKAEGGGSPATIDRIGEAFWRVQDRIKALRRVGRKLGKLVIVGGGDLVEGCAMFPGHSYQIDMDRREQVRAVVALGLHGLDLLAPMFEEVVITAVPGNHGENRVDFAKTTRGDNDDVSVFEHMRTATDRDERLRHVAYHLPDQEQSKTLEVAGWILGTTHGQAYGKSPAGSVEQKAYRWFSGQAAGKHPIGDSDVLLTHHFHHFAARDWGGALWLQTPAMDGGSAWLTDQLGMHSRPGMLTFTMSPESRCSDLEVLG